VHYTIASTGFQRSANKPSEPAGIAHAVLPGHQLTVCDQIIAAGLFYYGQDFTRTSLSRCPDCEGAILSMGPRRL
jgi:hypothetical protein